VSGVSGSRGAVASADDDIFLARNGVAAGSGIKETREEPDKEEEAGDGAEDYAYDDARSGTVIDAFVGSGNKALVACLLAAGERRCGAFEQRGERIARYGSPLGEIGEMLG